MADKRYRVWFTPNPPRKAFFTEEFDTRLAATEALDLISRYSLYLGEELIPVSAGGVERWDERGEDWEDVDLDDERDDEERYPAQYAGSDLDEPGDA